MSGVQGRCMRCKVNRGMTAPSGRIAANNKPYLTGSCAKCGCKMSRFVSQKEMHGGFLSGFFKMIGLGLTLPGTQTRGSGKKRS